MAEQLEGQCGGEAIHAVSSGRHVIPRGGFRLPPHGHGIVRSDIGVSVGSCNVIFRHKD
jgi:hypothetical protein